MPLGRGNTGNLRRFTIGANGERMIMRRREKLLRDPVHDLIAFDLEQRDDRLLWSLIDTREFQRLRHIRQMGMAHFAYHGCEHSRFPHSIGVMHLSRRMLERLAPGWNIDE